MCKRKKLTHQRTSYLLLVWPRSIQSRSLKSPPKNVRNKTTLEYALSHVRKNNPYSWLCNRCTLTKPGPSLMKHLPWASKIFEKFYMLKYSWICKKNNFRSPNFEIFTKWYEAPKFSRLPCTLLSVCQLYRLQILLLSH